MASPPQKSGASAKNPNVSADGSRISFLSQAALGEDPQGLLSLGGATYVASRGEPGWTTEGTVPDVDPRFANQWSAESERRPSFTPDFSRWLGIGATEQQLSQGIAQAYEAGLDDFYRPLSPLLQPFSGGDDSVVGGSQFLAASADHSHLYFRSGAGATYFHDDPTLNGVGSEPVNVYLAHSNPGGEPTLELLSRDRTDWRWGGNCGARLGGIRVGVGITGLNGARNQGAVSADGSRTYLSARAAQPQSGNCDAANKLRILERLETPSGPQITPLFASECARPSLPDPPGACSSADGDDLYQGASVDQTKVYFTTNRQLVDTDVDGTGAECSVSAAVPGCDLYLYDRTRPEEERLLQVSAGDDVPTEHEVGKEANVFNGITAISADGSHVYFVATGVLTGAPNPEGDAAQLGEPNFYLWELDSEETAFLGTLDPGDAIVGSERGRGLWGGEGTWRNGAYPVPVTDGEDVETGGDGHILAFESRAELTEEDGDGSHLDAYRYDAETQTLECVSCAPGSSPSEPDEAPFDLNAHGEASLALPFGTDFAERWRWVSEDGETVTFATLQGLLPGDVNGADDFYLWRGGTLVRLPGRPFGGSGVPPEAVGPFLSHDGSSVAFSTTTQLLPQDGDTAADIYVAREGGGFPNPSVPGTCEPGSSSKPCQEPEAQLTTPQATSEAAGAGNPPQRPRCRKGQVRRHGRCVKRRAKKRHRARQANADRRAGR
jgi:hypothetical protein